MAQAPTTWILTGSPETVTGAVRIAARARALPHAGAEAPSDRVRAAAGVPA